MKIHHLNCATFCPPLFGARVNRQGKLVCHCLLVESADGLILCDTGLGEHLIAKPAGRVPLGALGMLGARLDPEETAVRQIGRLGFSPKDVRHIVLTHLDFDHAGGIADFPEASVHIFEDEYQAAMNRATVFEKNRYCPAQWAHHPRWQRHSLGGTVEDFFGFQGVRALPGTVDELLIVPVTGHSRGHSAIAIKTDTHWLLHCGDAYFHAAEMSKEGRRCPLLLDWFQRIVQFDGQTRLRNQERLRTLAQAHPQDLKIFCAHDPEELAAFWRA